MTVVDNPIEDRAQLDEVYSQPFSACHAVPNLCRVAVLVDELSVRYLLIMQDHFFDDHFVVEPASCSQPLALTSTMVNCSPHNRSRPRSASLPTRA